MHQELITPLIVRQKFITSPIYYVNSKPHIGHAYTSIFVDVIARFYREYGFTSFTSFGTDEHGQKVAKSAAKLAMSPKAYVDVAHMPFINLLNEFSVDYSVFTRTTDDKHIKAAQHFWNQLLQNGYIYISKYSGWYAYQDEAYYTEDEIKNGHSKETGASVEWIEEDCFFFKMHKIRQKLITHYEQNVNFIYPHCRYNEAISMLRTAPDLAISRSKFDWGIQVPNNDNQIIYVWVEALVNYLTAINYPHHNSNLLVNAVHIIGKDILKFHAIYWPALLLAAGIDLPKHIYAHGWIKLDGEKMSKSKGNIIDPFSLSKEWDIDCLRYCMMRMIPYANDANFSLEYIKKIVKSDLIGDLGNLANRVLRLCCIKLNHSIPSCTSTNQEYQKILKVWDVAQKNSFAAIEILNVASYVEHLHDAVRQTNRYVSHYAPWNMDDPREILAVFCLCLQRMIKLYKPLMPNKMSLLAKQLSIDIDSICWDISYERSIEHPEVLF